ncbi:hypothetical protein HZF02_00910 [Pseudomonas yamanorum]|nr:hypothetical protein HZF02_00910 [Pseudomonas yamanorum]
MAMEEPASLVDIYRLAEALGLKLSTEEQRVLEALVRSTPNAFVGTSKNVVDQMLGQTGRLIANEKQRTRELMEKASTRDNVLAPDDAIRQWLAAKQKMSPVPVAGAPERPTQEVVKDLIRQEVKSAVEEQMKGLAQKVEVILGQLGEQSSKSVAH